MTRLDQALVERGLCDSREKAKRAIIAGQVQLNRQPARKPSDAVKAGDVIQLLARLSDSSAVAAYKLEHALDHFQLDVSGQTAIDLGASTGGFTDCLLAARRGQGLMPWTSARVSLPGNCAATRAWW